MSERIPKRDGAYSPANPKIDVYVSGRYAYSTHWYSTTKTALANIPGGCGTGTYSAQIDRRYVPLSE